MLPVGLFVAEEDSSNVLPPEIMAKPGGKGGRTCHATVGAVRIPAGGGELVEFPPGYLRARPIR